MAGPAAFGPSEARRLLRSVAIFAHLDDAALDALARYAEPRTFAANAVVVGQEELGNALFVLARGKVKVLLYGGGGRSSSPSSSRPVASSAR